MKILGNLKFFEGDTEKAHINSDGTSSLGGGGVTTQSSDHGPSGSNDRIFGSVYQNTSGKAMFVCVTTIKSGGIGAPFMQALTDAINPPTSSVCQTGFGSNTSAAFMVFFIVLNNNYYIVNGSGTIQTWIEWN